MDCESSLTVCAAAPDFPGGAVVGPGDSPSPAALLLTLQVSLPTPNFQTSFYSLPTRICVGGS